MGGKLFIQTHGCQMNEYDSGKMADILARSHGFEIVTDTLHADVLLLNTCAVREKPQEKVLSQLGRWHELKQQCPELVIGVGGCVASQEGDAILKRAPYVDLIFRAANHSSIARSGRSPGTPIHSRAQRVIAALPNILSINGSVSRKHFR